MDHEQARQPPNPRFFPPSQMSTKRPKHRRVHSASSSASHTSASSIHLHPKLYPSMPTSTTPSDNVTMKAASRILNTVRRSFNPHKKRDRDVPLGMYSTPEERESPSRFRFSDPSAMAALPPTPEEIAMGLHLSRTPHLGPAHRSHFGHTRPPSPSPVYHSHDGRKLPPLQFSQSSKSKPASTASLSIPLSSSSSTTPVTPDLSAASLSTTTITSTTPSTPSTQSSRSLKARVMSKLHLGGRDKSTLGSPATVEGGPKKAVRFIEESMRITEEFVEETRDENS